MSLVVTLDKQRYVGGDVIQGQLTVSVSGPHAFECEGVTLALVGVEQLKWATVNFESAYRDEHEKSHQFVNQQIQIPVSLKTPLGVGRHVFPFVFPLATNLPASLVQIEPCDHTAGVVEARITYTIEALLHAKGQKEPQKALHPVTLHAVSLSPPPPRQPTSASTSQRVKFFCCLDKGTCEVSAGADFDEYDLFTGVINIQATVLNGTTLPIRGLVFSLRRVLDLHVP